MKTLFYKLWAARCMPIKLAGLVFLAIYFYSHPVLFSPFWALAYFGLSMIGVLLYVWGTKLAAKFKNEPHYINEEAQYMYEHVSIIKKDNPLCFWLAPAETAFFYVPLLYVGVNPISAAVAAALFGFMHYPQQMLRNCIFKIFLAVRSHLHGIAPWDFDDDGWSLVGGLPASRFTQMGS